jgi:hypothetical protein
MTGHMNKCQGHATLPGWFCMRVFYPWRPGFLKVEHVMPPQQPDVVTLLDVWVDEIPLALVPPQLRVSNSRIMVWIERDMVPIKVQEKSPD